MNKKFKLVFWVSISLMLFSCAGKIPGVDARKVSYDPKERVKKNLEEGKGFRLSESFGKNNPGNFEFASSNELWRASLDTIDFMPIATANYSGGILITDWYSDNKNLNEYIKISIRFLTNEVRSDAIDIKIFYKICEDQFKCTISEKNENLKTEIQKEILKKAAIYKNQTKDKKFKPYNMPKDNN